VTPSINEELLLDWLKPADRVCLRSLKHPTPTYLNMANPSFFNKDYIIQELEDQFPNTHPTSSVDQFELGYRAGAIEVIRRLKEKINGNN
jgi:hypothetical protein